jgi:hypothetical protein
MKIYMIEDGVYDSNLKQKEHVILRCNHYLNSPHRVDLCSYIIQACFSTQRTLVSINMDYASSLDPSAQQFALRTQVAAFEARLKKLDQRTSAHINALDATIKCIAA